MFDWLKDIFFNTARGEPPHVPPTVADHTAEPAPITDTLPAMLVRIGKLIEQREDERNAARAETPPVVLPGNGTQHKALPPTHDVMLQEEVPQIAANGITNGAIKVARPTKVPTHTTNGHSAAQLALYEVIRPALNIETHADVIFAPSHSKNLHKPRTRTWVKTLPDGTKARAYLTVEPYRNKRLTTLERRIYLALERLREQKGKNEQGHTRVSFNEITKAMERKWNGGKWGNALDEGLWRIRFAPLRVKGAFEIKRGSEVIEPEDGLTLLKYLKVVKRRDRQTKEIFEAICEFSFHEYVQNYLDTDRTKPTLTIELGITGELASLLYQRYDLFLASRKYYERHRTRTEKLFFEDLELESEEYRRYPKRRKRVLEQRVIKHIDERPISTGILRCAVEDTTDGTDYNFVVWKEPDPTTIKKPQGYRPSTPANPSEDIPAIIDEIGRIIGHREVNTKLYTRFASAYPHYPVIHQALSEYRADSAATAHSPAKVFNTILHRIAHGHGYEWIKSCPPDCPLRPTK